METPEARIVREEVARMVGQAREDFDRRIRPILEQIEARRLSMRGAIGEVSADQAFHGWLEASARALQDAWSARLQRQLAALDQAKQAEK